MRRNAIKTDIFSPVFNLLSNGISGSLTYERFIKKRHSAQITLQYTDLKHKNYLKRTSLQGMLDYKFFMNRNPKVKYFIGAYCKYVQNYALQIEYDFIQPPTENETNDRGIYCGIINDVQFFIKKKIAIELLVGAGYGNSRVTDSYHSPNLDYSGPDLRIAINIGFLFY